MKIFILVLFLSLHSYGFTFDESSLYDYTEEQIVFNMVEAINERCHALINGYSVYESCESPTNISYSYFVDPIDTNRYEVAWGDGVFTKTIESGSGTNRVVYTNYYIKYEYDEGSEPYGYVWVDRSALRIDGMAAASIGSFLAFFDPYYADISGNQAIFETSKVLLRPLANPYKYPNLWGITLNKPYLQCETGYEANISEPFVNQIAGRTKALLRYYLDNESDSLLNKDYPWWKYGRVNEKVKDDDGIEYFKRKWRSLNSGKVLSDGGFRLPSDPEYFLKENGQLFVSKTEHIRNLYFDQAGIEVAVEGWSVGNLDEASVTAIANVPSIGGQNEVGLKTAFYNIIAFTNSGFISFDGNEYINNIDRYPVAQLTYQIVSQTQTSRVIAPKLHIYSSASQAGGRWWLYNIDDLNKNLYTYESKTSATNNHARYNNVGLKLSVNNLVFKSGDELFNKVLFPDPLAVYGDYPDGYNATRIIDPRFDSTSAGFSGADAWVSESTNYIYTINPNDSTTEEAIDILNMSYDVSVELSEQQNYVQLLDTNTQSFKPDYDLSREIIIYNNKGRPPVFYTINYSHYKFGHSGSTPEFFFNREFMLAIWKTIKNMKRTKAFLFAYPEASVYKEGDNYYSYALQFENTTYRTVPCRTNFNIFPPFTRSLYDVYKNNLGGVIPQNWSDRSRRIINKNYIFNPINYVFSRYEGIRRFNGNLICAQGQPATGGGRDKNASISLEFLKHPNASGSVNVYAVYEDLTEYITEEVYSYSVSFSSNSVSPCQNYFVEATLSRPSKLIRPDKEIEDAGLIHAFQGSIGSDYVKVNFSIPDVDYTTPGESYNSIGSTPNPPCRPIYYGEAFDNKTVSINRHYDFVWEWNFKYK